MSATRPLPGIRFETVTRPAPDVLPRMDIPVFVGFAASGPVNKPAAVSDAATFADVFGGDVDLPAPAGAAEARTAHLGPAVRAFFRNGGIRCWIVRVAGEAARANEFFVPGLYRVTTAGALEQAMAPARSEGSWSDGLRVRTRLVGQSLRFAGVDTVAPSIDVAVASSRDVGIGDLVRATWIDTSGAVIATLFLFVDAVTDAFASPLAGGRIVRLTGHSLWTSGAAVLPPPAPGALTGTPSIDLLTFELLIDYGDERPAARLSGLGFSPLHPRYFGALPTDSVLFDDYDQFVDGATPTFKLPKPLPYLPNFLGITSSPEQGWPQFWRDTLSPRFPLAALADGAAYVPATMPYLFSDPEKALAGAPADTALHRDGLASFSPALFVDFAVDGAARDVVNRADALRYGSSTTPHTLIGVHAALPIEEATLLAAPDAVHCGWQRDVASPIASPPPSSPLMHPEWWPWLDCHEDVPSSPPSLLPGAGFVDCDVIDPIPAPVLSATAPVAGSFDLTWDHDPNATEELQEATRPDFKDAAVIADGAAGEVSLHSRPAGDYFYRIRRLIGDRTSDWSNGVAVRVAAAIGWIGNDETGAVASLVTIHRAMLRLCAGRADMTAILTLPRHYDAQLAIGHVTNLLHPLAPEPETWSYGALWHPWVLGRDDESGPLAASPPDGVIAGTIALRAIARGAWVAPANEPLQRVVALDPEIPVESLQSLQDTGVNVIRQEPSGFVCLDADTLTDDDTIRPLNVRRLLILIRRAAIRVGNRYTFEPNDDALARAVKRGFESMLETMFLRGAFKGRTARAAFQVTTDDTVNTRQANDQGRFLAEIRVAPSQPMSFLTVRLLQSGDRTVVVEAR